jgi:hypothetical protein
VAPEPALVIGHFSVGHKNNNNFLFTKEHFKKKATEELEKHWNSGMTREYMDNPREI